MNDPQPSIPQIAGIVLNDLRFYLETLDPVAYQSPMDLLSGSTIGQHTRHIIEFYTCLIEQSTGQQEPVINYAKRRRDYQIESQPEHAMHLVNELCLRLKDLDAQQHCFLDCEEHGHENLLVSSTIGRELIYNIEHTIHHLAIVKIALKATYPSITLPDHFGVAPSTIRHRQEACAQ